MEVKTLEETVKELAPAQVAEELVALETQAKRLKAKIDSYKLRLLEEMKNKKVISLKLESMTVTRQNRKTVKVLDDQALEEYLLSLGHEVITKKIVNMDYMKPLVTSLLEENEGEIDGAQMTETEFVSVRLAK